MVPRAHPASGDPVAGSRRARSFRGALALALAVTWAAAAAAPSFAQGPGNVETDVPYANVDGQTLAMDVYEPSGGGTHPGVLLVHGGGFSSGRRTDMAPIAQRLSGEGYVAFTIDYRLMTLTCPMPHSAIQNPQWICPCILK